MPGFLPCYKSLWLIEISYFQFSPWGAGCAWHTCRGGHLPGGLSSPGPQTPHSPAPSRASGHTLVGGRMRRSMGNIVVLIAPSKLHLGGGGGTGWEDDGIVEGKEIACLFAFLFICWLVYKIVVFWKTCISLKLLGLISEISFISQPGPGHSSFSVIL